MNALLLALLLAQTASESPRPFFTEPGVLQAYEREKARVDNTQPMTQEDYLRIVSGRERAVSPTSSRQLRRMEEDARERVRQEPHNPQAWWTSGFILGGPLPASEEHLLRALELGIEGPQRTEALFALAALVSVHPEKAAQADTWFNEALADSWEDGRLLKKGASYLTRMKDHARAQRVLERLSWMPPVDPEVHAQYALALSGLGQDEAAARQVRLARQGGLEKGFFPELLRKGDHVRKERQVTGLFVGQVLVLALSLLALYLAGTLLSRAQIKRLAAVDARLLRQEQTPQERLVDRLYNAVLWGASLLFYVFALSIVGLTLCAGWAFVTSPSLKLFAILALNLWGSWGLMYLVLMRESWGDERRLLTQSEAPRLFAALEEVARVAQLPAVDRVYVSAGAGISVAEEGGTWKVLTGRGERVLRLGLAALRQLSVSELKAVLAHEYGHFSHGEMRLAPVIHRILTWAAHTLRTMASQGAVRYVNPWYGFLRAYFFVYLGVSQGHSRRCELLADRSAALAYGGATFGTALTQVVHNSELFERLAAETLMLMRRTRRPCEDLYRCLDAADALTPDSLQMLRTKELRAREPGTYDSHPPVQDRIRRVAGIRGQKPLETALALTLFEAPEVLAREFTQGLCMKLVGHLRLEVGEPPPLRTDVGPELQEQFASGFSLFQDAMELRERKHPEADATVLDAARLVEASVDANEPVLVSVLQEAAGAYHRRGDSAAAEACVQRARAVVEAHPDPGDKREVLRKLDQQLALVRTPSRTRAAAPK